MTVGGARTAFVTEAAGFVGTELVRLLVAQGHQVLGLTRSFEEAERVRRAGATPVMGNPLTPGQWQDEAAADWVFHLSPDPLDRGRLSRKRTQQIARERLLTDRHLLDQVAAGTTRRVVYVAGTSCYGATGVRPVTEDEPFRPSGLGRSCLPALDRLDGYITAGLPIITAFPGWVYGNGSWFRKRVMEPTIAGRRLLQFGRPGPWVSPIHVHDCARALLHLAQRPETGGRYFVVNSDPVRLNEFAETFARLANRPSRVWRTPAAAARLIVGPVLAEHFIADAVFSNIRLRGTGFRYEYPTLEDGIRQIVKAQHE